MKGHPRTDELLAPFAKLLAEHLPDDAFRRTSIYNRAWGVVFSLCLEVEEARRGEVAGAVLAERLNRDLAETRRQNEHLEDQNAQVRLEAGREVARVQGQLDAAGARLVTASRERDAARDNFLGARDERDRLWLELKKLGVVRSDADVQAVSDAVRAATRSVG